MTDWHQSHHIKALTGRWMDTVPGRILPGGGFHRLDHGHHVFRDGLRVLYSDKLKFGEFLHHLGLDFVTKAGIPNPILPTSSLFKVLRGFGMSATTANERLTINLSKVLGGGLSLLVAGHDVYACFADTIPHTFSAAGYHLGIGALNLIFGNFPPNPFLLLAGGSEILVGGVTGILALHDVIAPQTMSVLEAAQVYFPIWAEMTALSALLGTCIGYWNGQSISNIVKGTGITVVASGTATAISGVLAGNFIAPFIGGFAGFATGLLLRRVLMYRKEQEKISTREVDAHFKESAYFKQYSPFFDQYSPFFDEGTILPMRQLPALPIGQLKGATDNGTFDGTLLLDTKALNQFNK